MRKENTSGFRAGDELGCCAENKYAGRPVRGCCNNSPGKICWWFGPGGETWWDSGWALKAAAARFRDG
jgi:hypothetical protein